MFVFEITSIASYRPVISTLSQCQKDPLVLNFLLFQTHFYAKIQVQFSSKGLIWIVSTRGELCFVRDVSILFLASESW